MADRHEEPLVSVYEAKDVLEQREAFLSGEWMGFQLSSLVWVVNRVMKPWTGVGESGASQRFPERVRYHIWVEKNAPWMGPHLRRKLVMIFGSGIKRESLK